MAAAFVAAAPVLSRRPFVGTTLTRAPAPVGAAATMRVSKAMPKTPAKGSSGKRSKALPFVDAPDGLKESQDGCTFGLATTAPAAEGAWTEQRKDGRGDGGEEKGGRMGGRDAEGGEGDGSTFLDISAARGPTRKTRSFWRVSLTRSCVMRCSTLCLVLCRGSFVAVRAMRGQTSASTPSDLATGSTRTGPPRAS